MKIETEALIIGAGPIGLFQAFELGLQGIDCCIVEALHKPGGQCAELYPDKPIYDIPGTAYTTATDFISQLLKQIEPFKTDIHYRQTVEKIEPQSEGFIAHTHSGHTFHSRTIFLATGAGAFTPVKLRTDGIDAFEGSQVLYDSVDQSTVTDKAIVVTGDGEDAVASVIESCKTASSVVLLHRKRRLEASADRLKTLAALVEQDTVTQIKGKITDFNADDALRQITVRQSADVTTTHSVDIILVRQGNSPKQSDLPSWGIDTTARHVTVSTEAYESNVPGIYAVGDINSYPAKRKLILCGFHEATLAAFAATAALRPDKPLHLQYTTTSTELLERLGVREPG